MKSNPIAALSCLLRGLQMLHHPRLRLFVVMPLVINTLIFSLLIWWGVAEFETLLNWLLPEDSWLDFLRWLLWPLFALTIILLLFYTFTLVANLIAAPFNDLLAARVVQLLGGTLPDSAATDLQQAMKGILPALMGEGRKMGYFLLRAVPLIILFLIPGLNLLAPFLWLLFSAWFLALEYFDYPMGNQGIEFSEQLDHIKPHRLALLGFGSGVTLMMMVPLLNFVAMPAAVIGATLYWHERLNERV